MAESHVAPRGPLEDGGRRSPRAAGGAAPDRRGAGGDPPGAAVAGPADVIDLTVERPAVGGRMIARWGGRVVLVAGAIPGEQVRAAVEGARGGALFARTVEVTRPSPDRRPVAVPASCGGRTLAHVAYPRQLALKSAIVRDAFRRIGRIDLPEPPAVAASPETGYRLRARLHAGDGGVGFLDEGSHRVCGVAGTGVLSAGAERAVAALNTHEPGLASIGVSAVELTEDLAADRRALQLSVRGRVDDSGAEWEALAAAAGVSGLSAASRTVAGPSLTVGSPFVADPLARFLPSSGAGTLVLRRHAAAFFQANRHLVPALTATVAELAGGGDVVDLYAGVGLFAVALAARGGGGVTAVERDPVGACDLAANAAPLGDALRIVRAPVETYLKRSGRLSAAAVIVDPPRAGLSREAVTRLARRRPRRIVYVSCDVATQARDLRALRSSGYRLGEVRAFDMFPNTAHVETVVALDRA